jgi:hypothetical protein
MARLAGEITFPQTAEAAPKTAFEAVVPQSILVGRLNHAGPSSNRISQDLDI